jgi:hypothetical protein
MPNVSVFSLTWCNDACTADQFSKPLPLLRNAAPMVVWLLARVGNVATYNCHLPPLIHIFYGWLDLRTKMVYQAPPPLRYVAIFAFILPVFALRRTIGPPDDSRFIKASQVCNVTWPESFEFGVCSITISCVYQNLTQALIASLGAGTSIAALLPTILALIGESSHVLILTYFQTTL